MVCKTTCETNKPPQSDVGNILCRDTGNLNMGRKSVCVFPHEISYYIFLVIIIFLQKTFVKLFPKQLDKNRENQMPDSKTKIHKIGKGWLLITKNNSWPQNISVAFFFI